MILPYFSMSLKNVLLNTLTNKMSLKVDTLWVKMWKKKKSNSMRKLIKRLKLLKKRIMKK